MTLSRMLCAVTVLCLGSPAIACEYMTTHFQICTEGTPFATGVWEQGGDSSTLYLGEIGFQGFEDYIGQDNGQDHDSQLNRLVASSTESGTVDHHSRDKLTMPDLRIVRSIDTIAFPDTKPILRVTMIAASITDSILLMIEAPADTPLDAIDQLSRDYAALIRPRQEN
jgi:hypothetical protein